MNRYIFITTLLIISCTILNWCMITWPIVDDLDHYKKWDTYENIRMDNAWERAENKDENSSKESEELIQDSDGQDSEFLENTNESIEQDYSWEALVPETNVCTADVKLCNDGSYVSRWWPNCEFWPCPSNELDEK